MEQKIALVAGATGLVGKHLCELLADDANYSKIIVLARREPQVKHPKIETRLIDFDQLPDLTIDEKIDECFCTLGTTQKKSGKKGLYKVDYEYVVNLAALCEKLSVPRFLIVSSQGANHRSMFFYMRTKGLMEKAVQQKKIESVYIVRPSLITGQREETRTAELIGEYLYKALKPLMIGKLKKMRAVSALQIAKCLIALASNPKPGYQIIESDYIQDIPS